MLCTEDNRTYRCLSSTLSIEDKEVVEEDDLIPGAEMVWKNKGKLYTVVLQEVHGKHMD